ncbi:recombinase family protein [Patiriisocius marinus]|nr:recombinase family protein [Patiriisocius marinus]
MSRVSSDDQVRGYSLDVQFEQLTKHCQRHDIDILKHYREDHSAKNFNRPEFQIFLEYAKRHKNQIDYLFITTWDRFSRNMTDANLMLRTLRALGIEVQAIEQPIDFSIPESKAMLAIYLVFPEIDNDRRSLKIRGGIRGSLKAGRWCRQAPIGYKNTRDDENKPIIIPSEKAKHIQYAYNEIIKGKSQADIRKDIKEKGVIISRNNISLILKNPMYMGKIVVPAKDDEPKVLVEGLHEAIISEETFYQVQNILNKRKRKSNRPVYNSLREELPLRGLIYCSNCNGKMTGSPSRSQNGKQYFYYHCNHCKKDRISAINANKTIESILDDFKFSKGAETIYEMMVQKLLSGNEQQVAIKRKKLNAEIVQTRKRLEKLQDLYIDGKMEIDAYTETYDRYSLKRESLKLELKSLQTGNSQYRIWLNKGVHLLKNLKEYYKKSSVKQKQMLLSSIFPENLFFEGNECRTARINDVLRFILQIDNTLGHKKRGQFSTKLKLSSRVEKGGITPPPIVRFNFYWLNSELTRIFFIRTFQAIFTSPLTQRSIQYS